MIIAVASAAPVITSLVISLRKYLTGRRGRSIKIEINGDSLELTAANAADAKRIIADFIARHSRAAQEEKK